MPPTAQAWLLGLQGPYKGQKHHIAAEGLTMGRSQDNALCLQENLVSRHHGSIVFGNGSWVVYDCGSANGTWVNNQRVCSPVPLQGGEIVQIGNTLLQFWQ